MVATDLFHRLRDQLRISIGIQSFSKSSLALSPDLKRRLTGTAFLLVTAVSAWIAHEASRSSALKEWESQHSPNTETVSHSLASFGLSTVSDVVLIHRTLRELPVTLDLEGSVWIDSQSHWVVVFRKPDDMIPAEVYRWEPAPKAPPKNWEPMGTGWVGFERLLSRLKETRNERKKLAPIRSVPEGDPREIRY